MTLNSRIEHLDKLNEFVLNLSPKEHLVVTSTLTLPKKKYYQLNEVQLLQR